MKLFVAISCSVLLFASIISNKAAHAYPVEEGEVSEVSEVVAKSEETDVAEVPAPNNEPTDVAGAIAVLVVATKSEETVVPEVVPDAHVEARTDEEEAAEGQQSPVADAAFTLLDSCLKRAAASFPRDADVEDLSEMERRTISQVLARSECPSPATEEGGSVMRTFTITSTCEPCNTDDIDLQTDAGRMTVNGMVSECSLNADSVCCACMLKYIAGNYFQAILPMPITTAAPAVVKAATVTTTEEP